MLQFLKRLFVKEVYVACYLGLNPEVIGVAKTLDEAKAICRKDVIYRHGSVPSTIHGTWHEDSGTFTLTVQVSTSVKCSYGYRIEQFKVK